MAATTNQNKRSGPAIHDAAKVKKERTATSAENSTPPVVTPPLVRSSSPSLAPVAPPGASSNGNPDSSSDLQLPRGYSTDVNSGSSGDGQHFAATGDTSALHSFSLAPKSLSDHSARLAAEFKPAGAGAAPCSSPSPSPFPTAGPSNPAVGEDVPFTCPICCCTIGGDPATSKKNSGGNPVLRRFPLPGNVGLCQSCAQQIIDYCHDGSRCTLDVKHLERAQRLVTGKPFPELRVPSGLLTSLGVQVPSNAWKYRGGLLPAHFFDASSENVWPMTPALPEDFNWRAFRNSAARAAMRPLTLDQVKSVYAVIQCAKNLK